MTEPTRIVEEDRVEWRLNDQLHRVDGPAVEWKDGSNSWWINGKLHRENGPAIEGADGSKEWWMNGEQLSEHAFIARLKDR